MDSLNLTARTSLYWFCTLATCLILMAGCSHHDEHPAPPPASMTQHYNLIGDDGRNYGRTEMSPVGGGRVYDSDGRMIGEIVPPAPAH